MFQYFENYTSITMHENLLNFDFYLKFHRASKFGTKNAWRTNFI